MSVLRDMQQNFMQYLLGQDSGIDSQIESTPMMSAAERLHIYANAYRLRLKEALETDYEKLHAYLGDQQFDLLMDRYIDAYPSQTTSLRFYGMDMPTILTGITPYNQHAELYELALIEQAFANSFDAADAAVITLEDFAGIAQHAWPELKLGFQPSAQLLQLKTNAFAIWKALANEKTPPAAVLHDNEECWLLWRRSDLISHYRPVDPAEQAALSAAVAGHSFAEICEVLLNYFSEEETPMKAIGFLQRWVEDETLCALYYETNA
ncbi:DNA-binding domain-containing protein [Methylophaga sp. OBS4]|uniref:HvfC/BufC N-terminal domain-containing protein n=1 Tax=Methylophaga sp. OBS4 TaxID=2991935 RepID=UPI002252C408|nr:DNA-binding domain-containing protein [Methylophaga sp. OBS4]MCX4186689.1 DNA-binding domain-containing protein [Methylophaga sp. OBS4]